jgi:putative nucleotidyltransferase with HDIG domain
LPATIVFVLIVAYVLAKSLRFSIGLGTASPTQLVLVPMLLLLPPGLVAPLVIAATLVTRLPAYLRGRMHPDRALLVFGDAGYVLGPALVLVLADPGAPSVGDWPVYLLALVVQIVLDIGLSVGREWACSGVKPDLQLRLFGLVIAVDWALAPLGLLTAIVADHDPVAVTFGLPVIALLAILARERERGIKRSLELGDAYRGTALLLGDVLEADDSYTGGEHTQGVVALALEVGRELRLDAVAQRDLEFTALLHDIGKIRTPDEILNKPGKLTPGEWEIMKRHPIDGQQMLERIGGVLSDVGRLVRAHHERWDGKGYPDGLEGDAIPLAARIVCACDSFSAMTTNRSYRRAMSHADAFAELRACAGTQFDPRVVDALMRVLSAQPTPRAAIAA